MPNKSYFLSLKNANNILNIEANIGKFFDKFDVLRLVFLQKLYILKSFKKLRYILGLSKNIGKVIIRKNFF